MSVFMNEETLFQINPSIVILHALKLALRKKGSLKILRHFATTLLIKLKVNI